MSTYIPPYVYSLIVLDKRDGEIGIKLCARSKEEALKKAFSIPSFKEVTHIEFEKESKMGGIPVF